MAHHFIPIFSQLSRLFNSAIKKATPAPRPREILLEDAENIATDDGTAVPTVQQPQYEIRITEVVQLVQKTINGEMTMKYRLGGGLDMPKELTFAGLTPLQLVIANRTTRWTLAIKITWPRFYIASINGATDGELRHFVAPMRTLQLIIRPLYHGPRLIDFTAYSTLSVKMLLCEAASVPRGSLPFFWQMAENPLGQTADDIAEITVPCVFMPQ